MILLFAGLAAVDDITTRAGALRRTIASGGIGRQSKASMTVPAVWGFSNRKSRHLQICNSLGPHPVPGNGYGNVNRRLIAALTCNWWVWARIRIWGCGANSVDSEIAASRAPTKSSNPWIRRRHDCGRLIAFSSPNAMARGSTDGGAYRTSTLRSDQANRLSPRARRPMPMPSSQGLTVPAHEACLNNPFRSSRNRLRAGPKCCPRACCSSFQHWLPSTGRRSRSSKTNSLGHSPVPRR